MKQKIKAIVHRASCIVHQSKTSHCASCIVHCAPLKALLLLLVMGLSVNVWGAEASIELCTSWNKTLAYATAYTQDYTIDNLDGGTTTMTLGVQGVYRQSNSNTYFQMNKKTGYFKNTTKLPGKITKIETTWSVEKGPTKCYFATNAAASSFDQTVTVTAATSVTYTPDDEADYYYFNIDVSTGSGSAQMTSCVVYYEAAGDPTEPSLSVSPATIDFGTVYQNAEVDAKEVEVTFANLTTNDVAAAISGSAFSINKTGSFATGDKITITPNTATLGEYEETLTLSATGVDNQTVTVKMNVVEAPAPTGTFAKFTGTLAEGDYVICSSTTAMSNEVSSDRMTYATVTTTDDKVVNPDAALIWHIAASGDYWTLYNAEVEKYAASTGAKNKIQLMDAGTDDKALWTVSTSNNTYEFVNKANAAASVNANLRYNSGYGFACYATGTGSALTLYKKKSEGNVPVTGVSLPETAMIKTGGTQQLTPTFAPGDATNKNVTWEVTAGSEYIEISDAGLVTAKAEGEGTVKVTTEDGGFTATCVVTVKDGIANTKETAYTVAQAIALYDAGFDLDATVYVKGVVTSISGTNNNNVYIKDAGQSNSFEFYNLADGDATVSSLTQYDTIIGHGQLDKYGSTYEFKKGCILDERKPFVAPVVVTDPSNTPETAYTPAEAIAIYDNGAQYDLTKAVYVKGVVASKPSFTTSGDWKGSYYQVEVAAAETETPTFVFFHMFAGAESAQFTEDIVNAKDTLIAYGTLTKYNTTYELAERCYMYERKPYQAPVTGVTIDNKEGLTVVANEHITLTATISEAGATGTLVWSVIAGDTYASVDQTGKVTGLAAGEATIQVQVQGTEFTDQCTVTVTAAYEGATLPYSFDDNSQSTDPAFSHNGCGDYSSSPKLKFDGTGDYAIFHIAEAPAYMSFDIKGNGSPWAGQFDVLESADNETYTSVASYSALESSTTSLNVLLTSTSRYIKFVYTTKSSGNVALGNIKILATAPKVDPEFTIANVDVVVEDMAALQITTNSDGVVTYTIDPDNSGIEITDGTVYAHTAGTYTVTANKAETETYNAAQTTFTVTVSSVAYKTAEVSTFSAVNGGLFELGQFHSYKGGAGTAPAINNNHIRLYQNGGYITISALPGLKIAKIDISTAQSTLYNYKVDAAEDYTLTEAASLAKDATANLAGLIADSVRIYCLGTDKNSRFDVSYLKVYYTGELETVSALAVAGVKVTEYEINDVVDHTGAVVTATFATAGNVDVTLNSTFTDPDMSTPGTKQVTANFAEQTATYDITVKAETPEITVDVTPIDFGTVAQNAEVDAKTVAVTLKAIAEATVAVTGEGASAFNVTPASMTESGNITITPVTTTAGEFTATITISADGAEAQEVVLSMIVEAPDVCDGTDDFETSENTSATSYTERTTTAGWSAVNAARTKMDDDIFFTINGKTSAVGVITSPELEDGIASLKVRYANTFQEANGVSFRVDIKQGEDVVKTYTITKANATVAQSTVYTETISDINVAGTFQIVITNLSPSDNSTSNKDRVSIGRLCWSEYAEPEPVEITTETNASTLDDHADVTVNEGGNLLIDAPKTLGDIYVMEGGKVTIEGSATLTVNNFVIKSTMAGGESGQVIGVTSTNFVVTGDAYYDVVLGDNANPNKWHAFAVPFNVDAINDVYDLEDNKLTNEVNYAIMDYHGDVRAQGQYGWKKFRGIMNPGVFYLMTVDGARTTYRMKMNGGFHASSSTISVQQYAKSGAGANTDAGWNGIANNQLNYSSVAAPVQVLNPASYTFETMTASSTNFTVGTPFFYQAGTTGTIELTAPNASAYYAPRRMAESEIKDVNVMLSNDNYTDHLYLSATDEATVEYQIGRDLVKMAMTSTPSVPQIFALAYNTALCMVDAPMTNDEAQVSVRLYAPASGEYTLSVSNAAAAEVYLLRNGMPVWNLSESAYTLDLEKGNTEGYSLRIRRAHKQTTDMDAVNDSDKSGVQKIIMDNQLYIIFDGQTFNAVGQMVK